MALGGTGFEQPLSFAEVAQVLGHRDPEEVESAFRMLNANGDDVLDLQDIEALRKRPPAPSELQKAVDVLAIHLDETAASFEQDRAYLGKVAGFTKALGAALGHKSVLAVGHTAAGEVGWAAQDFDRAVEELAAAARLTPVEAGPASALANMVLAEAKLGKAVAEARAGKMAWSFYGEKPEKFLEPAAAAVQAWVELVGWQAKTGAPLPAEIEGFVAEVRDFLGETPALRERFRKDAAVQALLAEAGGA